MFYRQSANQVNLQFRSIRMKFIGSILTKSHSGQKKFGVNPGPMFKLSQKLDIELFKTVLIYQTI